jgi:hypothetical protein
MNQTKTVIEIPAEEFQKMKETGEKILKALENLRVVTPTEYLTPKEFCKETKMSLWKFAELRNDGKLNVKQVGPRKLYVPRTEVTRYFSGEMDAGH